MDINELNFTLFNRTMVYFDPYIVGMDIDELNLTSFDGTGVIIGPPLYIDYESIKPYKIHFDIQQKVAITLYSIISALGIIGNGLVIWIAGFRMKKTISAVWFLNLAIADFLCCASLPVRIADWLSSFSESNNVCCISSMFLFNLNMSASVFILTAMSIDRWLSIMWPFWAKVHRTRKLVRITVAIIWVLSLIFTGLLILLVEDLYNQSEWCSDVPVEIRFFYDVKKRLKVTPHLSHIVQLIRLLIMFVIPCLIISISYAFIFFKLRKSKRPQRSQRPYRIITAVILCFLICWSPYYVWPLTPMYYSHYFYFTIVNSTIIYLACLNSCINPIIYVFMNQDFQHSFLRSIPIRLEKALSEHPNDLYEEQEGSGSTHITAV